MFNFIVTSALMYWLFGYAFAWGDESNFFLGYSNFALSHLSESSDVYFHWMFHFTLAALACSIVSGALAERTNFTVYTLFTVLMSGDCKQFLHFKECQLIINGTGTFRRNYFETPIIWKVIF